MHDEYRYETAACKPMMNKSSFEASLVQQIAVDTAATLRRLIELRAMLQGPQPIGAGDTYKRNEMLAQKIIEIQGLLAL